MEVHYFVDASHSADKVTWRSCTDLLIFINKSPIMYYSKTQNLLETSVFGSKFMEIKQPIKMLKLLCYNQVMFGIPIESPASVNRHNKTVYKNVSLPSSVLSKKMYSISYCFCNEPVAAEIIRIAKEDVTIILVNIFTKVFPKVRTNGSLDKFLYLFIW